MAAHAWMDAQAFLWANRERPYTAGYDLDEVAASLAGLSSEHELWFRLEETQLREFHEAMDNFEPGWPPTRGHPAF